MSIMDRFRDMLWSLKKNKKAQIFLVCFLIIIAIVAGWTFVFSKGSTENPTLDVSNGDENPDRVVQSRRKLDGVYVAKEKAEDSARAVAIENLAITSVRPQAGSTSASIIYEFLVEGGITRWLMIFDASVAVPEIAPVRSARSYIVDIAQEYGGLFAHAGGSPEAMEDARTAKHLYNTDAISQDSRYFARDGERPAPHNLRTTSDLLMFAERDKNIQKSNDFDSWAYKEDASLSERPAQAKTLTIDFSTFNYKVEWKYDPATNRYTRYTAGVLHKDRNNDKAIEATNIIVQFVKTESPDGRLLNMDLKGSGGSLIFRDGEMINATWKKDDDTQRTRFVDEDGKDIELNAGQTWIAFLPPDRDITYE